MKFKMAIAAVAMLWAGTSSANTNMNVDGIAFHPSSSDRTTCGNYDQTSVTNNCASSVTFSASMPFVPTGTSNMTVYVDGSNPAGGTVTCYAYSYNYNGTFLGNASFTHTATGTFDESMVLASAALSNWAYLSVVCSVPSGGVLYGASGHY